MNRYLIEEQAQDYVSRLYEEEEYPDNVDDVEEAFAEGAEWRINSVWHKAEERPADNRTFLYRAVYKQSEEKYISIGTLVPEDRWYIFLDEEDIIAWAYIDDLLPDGKEDEI